MSKAFLSHSSMDKAFVSKVADSLGSALCHYDERTFEPAGESADEIIQALQNSDLFVLFLSENSLKSKWVQTEIRYARHLYFSGEIKSVAIFMMGDSLRERLDVWLRPFVVQTLMVPKLVGFRIRSLLSTADASHVSRFIGRDDEVARIKDSLRDLSASRPSSVLVSGPAGIGRKRLLTRVYQDLYPFLPTSWIQLEIAAFEGEVALYERLAEHFDAEWGWEDAAQKIESFVSAGESERFSKLVHLLECAEKSKQVVVLQSSDDLISADGRVVPWLLSLVRAAKTSYPVLIITTVRSPSPRGLLDIPDIPYSRVGSLQEKNARLLLSLLCEDFDVKIDGDLTNSVISFVGGHPGLIEISAKLIKATGASRFKIDLSSVESKSAVEEYVEKAISNVGLDSIEKAILLLLDEVGGAPREDVLFGFSVNGGDAVVDQLARLLDFGLIEEVGSQLQVASHLRLVMRRWKNQRDLSEILVPVRKRLIEIIAQAESLTGGSYLALRAPIAAAIREDGDFKSILVSRPLLAAQQLRVARRLYDERNFNDAATRAVSAYENKIALSDDGVVEVLRLIGLVGVRRRRQDLRDQSLSELSKIDGDKPKKLASFIKGFEARLSGEFKDAEIHLKVAMKRGGGGDFHVLRELAAALLGQGLASEAEIYARRALKIAPSNPYVLDILSACLIDRFRDSPSDYSLEKEISDLLSRLQISDERERQSFSPKRQVSFLLAQRNSAEAKKILDQSLGTPWYRVVQAEYLRSTGDARAAITALDNIKTSKSEERDEAIQDDWNERLIRVLALAQSGRLDEAVSEFRFAKRQLAVKPAEDLKRSLVFEIARKPGNKSKEVTEFINGRG